MHPLEVCSASFGYGARPVLHGVSLSVAAGEFVAVVGPNGSGKSTLMRLMAGLERPASGTVRVMGRDIATFSRRRFARHVALLTQGSGVPQAMVARDMVAMGRHCHQGFLNRRSAADDDVIDAALAEMEVADLALRRMGELSGGQVQRMRMAMVLAQGGEVLLLDEPTTFLDLRHQYGLLRRAKRAARDGRAVVAVLHDFTQASIYADRIALMQDGRMVGVGTPAGVLTEAAIHRVFGVRTHGVRIQGAVIHLPVDR
ncbi:ABC transporter ATP-binding protein [Falsirhodobacter sp. 20TX0035]|uniref:ABC transporter ATP-binding protein n=1 Tax=Falsirhodobacter sp. 20TX0035 TaxID=3022019 RepID=UPI00232F3C25|nr:ABC transporter ATP-binding protein [Falsirhodobacter sp. 20TX0035]MDB6454260.1 ABC transporter ATP-binding protein [Falsirhodobacter sp. 20TX0035]